MMGDKIGKLFGADNSAARQAQLAQQLAKLQEARIQREQAETTGAVASLSNRPRSTQFLSSAGFGGLRTRLGGARG